MMAVVWMALGAALTALGFWVWARFLDRRVVYDEMRDLREFHDRFGFLTAPTPGHLKTQRAFERAAFLQEELDEFKRDVVRQDLVGQLDALIDLVYVAKGTALMLGFSWEDHWEEVHRANMDKVPGRTHREFASKDVMKPKGWLPPQHDIILAATGYEEADWFTKDRYFKEETGRDYY